MLSDLIKNKEKYDVFALSVFLLWFKTYLVNKFYFKLPVDNSMQEFILFINPLSSSLLLFGIVMLISVNNRNKYILVISIVSSFVIYGNILFHRFYNDFISLPVLFQTSNMGDLGSSVTELLKYSDILFFLDLLVLSLYLIFKKKTYEFEKTTRGGMVILILSISIFIVNLALSEIQRPQLLSRTFDREMLVKNIGTFNYHIYDVVLQTKSKAKRAFADGEEIKDILNYSNTKVKNVENEMTGIGSGKNVVYIALESLQEFVMESDVDGNEITPFLNSLLKDSYYFTNFYHQTAQGKSSDSEFTIDTSMYPLPSGAVYFTHAFNKYNALPKILGEAGYNNNVFHANNSSFWNRDQMYKSMGYDKFYDLQYYDVDETNAVGWGLKDDHFFDQSIKYMKDLKEPYSAKLITLTNHFPFNLDEEDLLIPVWDSNSGTLNRYFTTVRYMDEALKYFFESLKEEGLYENTVFVMYGDHYGISNNHNKAMGTYLGHKISEYDEVQLQKVPLLIHIPGEEGKRIDTVGGQIDIKPTLLNILGIKIADNDIIFGNDLFSPREELMIMRNGNFVTEKYVSVGNTCYTKTVEDEKNRLLIESKLLEDQKLMDEELENMTVPESEIDPSTELEEIIELEESIGSEEGIDSNLVNEGIGEEVGQELEIENEKDCDYYESLVNKELKYSDQVIYGDLLRFVDNIVDTVENKFRNEELK